MAASPKTALIGLSLPIPGVTQGPQYAVEINENFSLLDRHDHSAGKGQKISPAGLSINSDLSMNNNDLVATRTIRYQNLTATLGTPSDTGCVYVVAGDLYYNDGTGTPIRLTLAGSINIAATGTIGGDYATSNASISYSNTTGSYNFFKGTPNTATPAKILGSDISIYDSSTAVNPNAVTIKTSAALASSFTLTLPPNLPPTMKLLSLDAAGAIGAAIDVDNVTLSIDASNQLSVITPILDADEITLEKTNNKIQMKNRVAQAGTALANNIAYADIPARTIPMNSNLQLGSVSLASSGKPFIIKLVCGASTAGSYIYGTGHATFNLFRDVNGVSTQIGIVPYVPITAVGSGGIDGRLRFHPEWFDIVVPPGVQVTYRLVIVTPPGGYAVYIGHLMLLAYEVH